MGIKVDPPYRRRGIGYRLMRQVDTFLRESGLTRAKYSDKINYIFLFEPQRRREHRDGAEDKLFVPFAFAVPKLVNNSVALLILHTRADNIPAQNLFRKCGFVVIDQSNKEWTFEKRI